MIYCVVPTVRPEMFNKFREAWAELFLRHDVTLVAITDGDDPGLAVYSAKGTCLVRGRAEESVLPSHRDLFYNRTDSVRNYGFAWAAKFADCDHVLTLDDDVAPPIGKDPIAEHLAALNKRVPLSWMNTAPAHPGPSPYLRGVPYLVRSEGRVMLSHGVWSCVPDFDAPTQVQLMGQGSIPDDLPYYVGPVPKGVLFPLCGMNVMVERDALPYLYYAPMGPKAYNLNRFGDIWMGVALKAAFDRKGWACYTGAAKVVHTRASDVYKNLAQEAEGLRYNEHYHDIFTPTPASHPYFAEYKAKRERYEVYIKGLLKG